MNTPMHHHILRVLVPVVRAFDSQINAGLRCARASRIEPQRGVNDGSY